MPDKKKVPVEVLVRARAVAKDKRAPVAALVPLAFFATASMNSLLFMAAGLPG